MTVTADGDLTHLPRFHRMLYLKSSPMGLFRMNNGSEWRQQMGQFRISGHSQWPMSGAAAHTISAQLNSSQL